MTGSNIDSENIDSENQPEPTCQMRSVRKTPSDLWHPSFSNFMYKRRSARENSG